MRVGGDVRWIMRTARASVLAVGLAACSPKGGDPPAALDCAWLASDNCWKKTVAAATSCLPDSAAVGTLSADEADELDQCVYLDRLLLLIRTRALEPQESPGA